MKITYKILVPKGGATFSTRVRYQCSGSVCKHGGWIDKELICRDGTSFYLEKGSILIYSNLV